MVREFFRVVVLKATLCRNCSHLEFPGNTHGDVHLCPLSDHGRPLHSRPAADTRPPETDGRSTFVGSDLGQGKQKTAFGCSSRTRPSHACWLTSLAWSIPHDIKPSHTDCTKLQNLHYSKTHFKRI